MKDVKGFTALLVVVSIGFFGLSTVQASNASSNDKPISVCVNKKTEAVYYRTKCRANEARLKITTPVAKGLSAYEIWLQNGNSGDVSQFLLSLKGADGTNGTSMAGWLPGSTCSQKLKLAEAAGFNLVFKNQRRNFEFTTGCVVEKILGSRNDEHKASGFPYVESISRIGIYESGPSGGDVFGVINGQTFKVKYRLKIKNLEAAQAAYGSPLEPCAAEAEYNNGDTPESVQSTAQNDVFEYTSWIRASSQDNTFFTPVNVALCDVETSRVLNQFTMAFLINENPQLMSNVGVQFDPGFARIWGW